MDTNNTVEIPAAMPRAPADVNTLLNRLLDEAEQASPSASGTESTPQSASAAPAAAVPPLGGAAPLLGNLLANPALLTALPTLVENLSPLLGSFQRSAASGGSSVGGVAGGGAPKGKPYPTDRHTALLCAIKPYLGSQRQEAAETVIRLCRVWDALGRSGISLSGLLSSLGGAVPAAAQPAAHEQEVT